MPAGGFVAVGYGMSRITLGFEMEGSNAVGLLNEADGVQQRRGKMLGSVASWGKWSHTLGRSVAHWKSDTKRLYVQAKLAEYGELCPPDKLGLEVEELMQRMAAIGIISYHSPWVTRLTLAVRAIRHFVIILSPNAAKRRN